MDIRGQTQGLQGDAMAVLSAVTLRLKTEWQQEGVEGREERKIVREDREWEK